MITILDYGLGNTGSILNALDKLGFKAKKTNKEEEISKSEALIFPGDGAAGRAMENLKRLGLRQPIKKYIQTGKPFLGICLGMQILMNFSEEGNIKCLGIIEGKVRKFNNSLKIPQIGWNQVIINNELRIKNKLFKNISDGSYFYFINSYYCEPEEKSIVKGVTDYGREFCSVFVKENIIGVQFHPEKSGKNGFQLLKNFIKISD